MTRNMFESPRLFLYLGIGLIVFSLFTLPIKTEVNVQTPDVPDYETFNIGFLLTPVVGSFGLASLALGIAEVSLPKKNLLCLLPVGLVYAATAFAIWMAVSFGFNAPFWWVYALVFFIPAIIAGGVGVTQFTGKKILDKILKNKKAVSIILFAIPLLFIAALWLLFFSF